MSKSIDLHLSQIRFPYTCVVCMSPATQAYKLQKVFAHRRRSYVIRVSVPMCDRHFDSANFKGIAEKLVGTLSLSLAPIFGKPASKAARRAVRFTRYWPEDQFVRLEFQNEQLADIVRNSY